MEIKEELKNLLVSTFIMIGSGIAFFIEPLSVFFAIFFGVMIVNFAYCYSLYKNHYFESEKDTRFVQAILGLYILIVIAMLIYYVI